MYAAGKTGSPLAINLASGLVMVGFGYAFMWIFEHTATFRFFVESLLKVTDLSSTSVLMLPLAYSLGAWVNTFIFWVLFEKQFKNFTSAVVKTFLHSFSASVIAGYIAYLFLDIFDNIFNLQTVFGVFMQGFASGILGIVAGALVLRALGNRELVEIWRTLHHKIWRAKIVSPEPADTPSIQ